MDLYQFLDLMRQELVLTGIIFLLLFIKIGSNKINTGNLLHFINLLLLVNLIFSCIPSTEGVLFNSMFGSTHLIQMEKAILNFGVLIISLQAFPWLKAHKHAIEFYMLLLSTLLGMFFMISSGNFLMFYLGLELSTIPLAALANYDLEKRESSESAMKLIMNSAFSSGILLFGISMLYGTSGSIDFAVLSQTLTGSPLQIFAFICILSGFAFKLSAVPFHLWTADVYEGAPVAVTAYLSVISKGSIVFIFGAVLFRLFGSMEGVWHSALAIIAVATIITGNLFAIRQNNIKRFLAFSSIAQVGFILIGLYGNYENATTSTIYFILIYIFSNLGAFGVVGYISSMAGKENISDYKGLYKTNPILCWIMALALFSLAGIPPTAGFFGKFFLLASGAAAGNYSLIIIAALNMIISLYYYLIIIKAMFMDENENPIPRLEHSTPVMAGLLLSCAGIIGIGFSGNVLDYINNLVK